jgi:RNase P/RNase MRP subunit p29
MKQTKQSPQNPKLVLLKDFIGKRIRIIEATDPQHRLLEGLVVDETRNLLEISIPATVGAGETPTLIKLPKDTIVFEFKENTRRYEVTGKDVVCAPENRTKKLRF